MAQVKGDEIKMKSVAEIRIALDGVLSNTYEEFKQVMAEVNEFDLEFDDGIFKFNSIRLERTLSKNQQYIEERKLKSKGKPCMSLDNATVVRYQYMMAMQTVLEFRQEFQMHIDVMVKL